MIDGSNTLALKAKLARSRAELLAAMGYEQAQDTANGQVHVVRLPEVPSTLPRAFDYLPRSRSAKLVACGAGAGALLLLLKPWKLLPLAATAALITQCSGVATKIFRRVAPRRAGLRQERAPR